MKIILPKVMCGTKISEGPLFFLAGPVKGGDDWQTKCCWEIKTRLPKFYAAIPCPFYTESHPLFSHSVVGREDYFPRQLNWERRYMEYASTFGCLIFWLPCESKTNPRTGSGSYAMDTRGELGEWRGRLMHQKSLNLVIGAEANFPGLDCIKRNFSLATESEFPIYGTLAETVEAAIKKAT